MKLLLAAALALAPLASRAAEDTRSLGYLLSSDVDSLDPDWAYDATSLFVASQLYETLIGYAGTAVDQYEPLIASVVPSRENGFISRDGLQYAFPLRRGVRFHDGSEMTPEDVKYSLMRFALTDRSAGPSALLLEPLIGRASVLGKDGKPDPAVYELLDRAISIEGGALVLRLRKPFAPLLSVLAGFAPVLSRSFVARHGGWDGSRATWMRHWNPDKEASPLYARANGTGPFRLVSWEKRARALRLERSPNYWRAPALLETVTLQTVDDARERARRMAAGEADVAQIGEGQAAEFEGIPGVSVDVLPLLEVHSVVFFNLKAQGGENPWLASGRLDGQGVPPDFFADAETRKAFAQAFDYDAYIQEAYKGKALRSRGPIPQSLFGHNPRQKPWTHSIEQAAQAFQRARDGEVWRQGFLLPVAYAEGRADQRAACRVLQRGLAKISPKFAVECRGVPQSRLLDELRARRLACFVFHWIFDYADPHNAVHPFLHSRGYFAEALSYSNPRADALIEQAQVEADAARRKALYAELQALAFYDATQIFTVETNGALARRQKVLGWTFNPIEPHGQLYGVSKLP